MTENDELGNSSPVVTYTRRKLVCVTNNYIDIDTWDMGVYMYYIPFSLTQT